MASGRGPKALLERYGLRPKASFGQNFLADAHLSARIAGCCEARGGSVVEIGAGLGALTRPLLDSGAAFVLAIERDRELVPVLASEFRDALDEQRLTVCEADAKAVDFVSALSEKPKPWVLAGNLPYQITGPLLEKATQAAPAFARAVFLVQLEVADRLAAAPSSGAYGALSVFAQRAFAVERAFRIRRGAFYPQPSVDSAVVVLTPLGRGPESEEFRLVVRHAFEQRRKQLRNAWAQPFAARGRDLAAAAARAGIDLSLRGENLTIDDFTRMAEELA
jgi:16S rRNA (adenine1518-N6/adenine1519-N6)-dimethyltransferase